MQLQYVVEICLAMFNNFEGQKCIKMPRKWSSSARKAVTHSTTDHLCWDGQLRVPPDSLWQFRQVVKHREFQGFLLQKTVRKPGADLKIKCLAGKSSIFNIGIVQIGRQRYACLLESNGPKSCASASVLADCLLRNPPKWGWFLQFDIVPRRFYKGESANPCAQRQKTMKLCKSSASLRWDHPAKSLIAL